MDGYDDTHWNWAADALDSWAETLGNEGTEDDWETIQWLSALAARLRDRELRRELSFDEWAEILFFVHQEYAD